MLNRRYLFGIMVFAVNFYAHANINNIRGTLSILKPEFYQYSIIHGAVAWEKDFVMNIWDLGWERKKANIDAGEKRDELINSKDASALVNVVDRLFHRPAGTVGRATFTPTVNIKNLSKEGLVKALAVILGLDSINSICDELLILSSELKGKVKTLNKYSDLFNEKSKIDLFKLEISKLEGISKACAMLKFNDRQVSAKRLVEIINKLFIFRKSCSALLLRGEDSYILVKAFAENNAETGMVLLALLWYCCKDDRSLLKVYYQELNKIKKATEKKSIFSLDEVRKQEIGAKFAVDPGWESSNREPQEFPINWEEYEPNWDEWVSEDYSKISKENIAQTLQQRMSDIENLAGVIDGEPQLYEMFVFLQLLPGKYPKISAYDTAKLWYNGTIIPKVSFADCMDSTMMNMICILAYNAKLRSFDVELLKQKLGVPELNRKLEAFFIGNHPAFEKDFSDGKKLKIFPTPENIENRLVHNAWTDVIANMPGIAFCECFSGGRVQKSQGKGFVFLQEQDKKIASKLEAAGYSPIIKDGICFEMQPSMKNFIVMLNYLLNLDLFNPQNVYKEILRPDFIKTYLPLLAQKLKIGFDPSVKLKDIDAKDFGEEIVTRLIFEQGKSTPFLLSTSYNHGELELQPFLFDEDGSLLSVLMRLPYYSDKLISLRGIKLIVLNKNGIKYDPWILNNSISWCDLCWLNNLRSHSFVVKVLDRLNKNSVKIDKICGLFFVRLADSHPDEYIKFEMFSKILKCLNEQSDVFKKLIAVAKDRFKDKDVPNSVLIRIIELFTSLVKNGQYIEDAIIVAQECFQNVDYRVDESTMLLFKALFERGQAFAEAIGIAQEMVKNQDITIQLRAISFFMEVVKHGQGFVEALNVAQGLVKSADVNLQSSVLLLLNELVRQGQGFVEVLNIAKELVKSANINEQLLAMRLLKELVKQGQAFTEAINAAQEGVKSAHIGIQCVVIHLLQELVKQGQAFTESINIAQEIITSKNRNVQTNAVNLFRSLIYAFREALDKKSVSQDQIINLIRSIQNKTIAGQMFNAVKDKFESGARL